MPAYIHRVTPGGEQFTTWVMPNKVEPIILSHTELTIAKLMLIVCEIDDEQSYIYQKDVPVDQLESEENVFCMFRQYKDELNEGYLAPSQTIAPWGEETVTIGSCMDDFIGLKVRHTMFMSMDQVPMSQQYGVWQ